MDTLPTKIINVIHLQQFMRRYTNIALPDDLIERIDKIIKDSDLGYKSRGEFVKEAVRNSLMDLTKIKKINKK